MNISTLIEKLKETMETEGDREVLVQGLYKSTMGPPLKIRRSKHPAYKEKIVITARRW